VDEPTIRCPKCKSVIKLTDAMAAPLLESAKAQYDNDLAAARKQIEQDAMHTATQRVELALAATKANANTAALKAANEASVLRTNLAQQETKLAEAQREQARLLAKEHELDEARRELELNVARQVQAQAATIRDQAKQAAESEIGLKVAEREEQIAAMTRQIIELKQRAEQGSTQLQGEVQELILEQALRNRFPTDNVSPIAKGVFGGDALHSILGPSGQACGSILFESKRTKTWSGQWLAKLRSDQRAAKADMAVLVTQAMPISEDGRPVDAFDLIEGVWVVSWRFVLPVVTALRQSLIDVTNARSVSAGQETKAELLYAYMTGPQFRHRLSAIIEKFSTMSEDLVAERKAITRIWAKREQQLQGALDASAGLFGDLQGIAGKSMAEIDGLSFKELE